MQHPENYYLVIQLNIMNTIRKSIQRRYSDAPIPNLEQFRFLFNKKLEDTVGDILL
jgi:hypothetical protein